MEPELKDIANEENIIYTDKKVSVKEYTPKEQQFNDMGLIENSLIILTKYTLDRFLNEENPAELISLYTFYYYTAKWQKTNLIKCTTNYVSGGLKWTENKVRKIKKQLKDLGLIEDYQRRNKESNKVEGHYIKMNYIFKQQTIDNMIHPNEIAEGGNTYTVENQQTNALSTNILNALNTGNINALNTGNINAYKETSDKSLSSNKPIKENKDNNINISFNKKEEEKEKKSCAKRKEKITDFCAEILRYWNDKKFYVHRNTYKVKNANRLLNEYTEDEIKKAIDNYIEIFKSEKYYWSHKWSLSDFLNRGLEKFSDQAEPFNNYKIKGYKEDEQEEIKEVFQEEIKDNYNWENGLLGDVS